MSVCAYSPFAYILAQAVVGFEQFVLKKYSCWFALTEGKNIVTNICKNICSFSAFFHWHFPTGSVANQSSKPMCHWASGERKQTFSNVDQKTPIHFDAALAVCLILSRLESQSHQTLLATRAKQSQTLPPTRARKRVLTLCFGDSHSWSTAGTTAKKKKWFSLSLRSYNGTGAVGSPRRALELPFGMGNSSYSPGLCPPVMCTKAQRLRGSYSCASPP